MWRFYTSRQHCPCLLGDDLLEEAPPNVVLQPDGATGELSKEKKNKTFTGSRNDNQTVMAKMLSSYGIFKMSISRKYAMESLQSVHFYDLRIVRPFLCYFFLFRIFDWIIENKTIFLKVWFNETLKGKKNNESIIISRLPILIITGHLSSLV